MTSDEKGGSTPVLVAIDFSADSAAALVWAARYAEQSGQRLALLHVVHEPAAEPGFYRDSEQDLLQPMETAAQEMMNQFLRPLLQEGQLSQALERAQQFFVPGLPATRIVEVAELLDAEPVVVGSRGRTGMPQILLGSVAGRVVELAHCPVVVVKSRRKEKASEKTARRAAKQWKKDRKRLEQALGLIPQPAVKEIADD